MRIDVNWDELATYGIGRNEPVWADLDDVPLATAVRAVFNGIVSRPVRYDLTRDGMTISCAESAATPPARSGGAPELVVRAYDVRDLLGPFSPDPDPVPPAPAYSLFGGAVFGGAGLSAAPAPPTSPRGRASEGLVALVCQIMASDAAPAGSSAFQTGGAASRWAGWLTVVTSEGEQKIIAELLRGLSAMTRMRRSAADLPVAGPRTAGGR